MFVIFDLDGTLANIEHRLHHITKDVAPINGVAKRKPDWDKFHRACVDDQLITPIAMVYHALRMQVGNTIEIWSGRSDKVRKETLKWLANWASIHEPTLLMRSDGDYRPDHELKELWLMQLKESGRWPDLVFDDRSRLVKMWRSHGIRCCQVADGDF